MRFRSPPCASGLPKSVCKSPCSGWFDERLAETVDATRGAIETALEQRRQHAEAAKAALSELRRAAECVAAVKLELPASPELAPAAMRTGDIIFTERE